ncbi:hypothetical protein IWZ00DRAFT_549782 [Phyllosticta capitalensis]
MGGYVLKRGANFWRWNTLLEGKLAIQSQKLDMFLLNHVFHDIKGIGPKTRPAAPADNECAAALQNYEEELDQWTRAKAIHDRVVQNFSKFAPYEYTKALDRLINTKFVSNVETYIWTFYEHLGSLNEAAWLMREGKDKPDLYTMRDGQAAVMFMNGTQGVDWLQDWRAFEAMNDGGGFASLTDMTRSLRVAADRRKSRLAFRCRGNEPTDLCNRKGCRRFKNHTNEECFKR